MERFRNRYAKKYYTLFQALLYKSIYYLYFNIIFKTLQVVYRNILQTFVLKYIDFYSGLLYNLEEKESEII